MSVIIFIRRLMSFVSYQMSDVRRLIWNQTFDNSYMTADVLCQMSDITRLLSYNWYQMSYVWYQTFDVWCHIWCQTFDVWWQTSYVICLMSNVRCLMFVWCHQISDDRRLMSYVWYQTSDGRRLILDVRCKMTDVVCLKSNVWCQISDVRHRISFLYKSFELHKNWNF